MIGEVLKKGLFVDSRGDTILSLVGRLSVGEGRPPRRPRQFEKHMTIRDARRADNPVGHCGTVSGRHGGRPSLIPPSPTDTIAYVFPDEL